MYNPLLIFAFFEIVSSSQAGLKLSVVNEWPWTPDLPVSASRAEITDVFNHTQFVQYLVICTCSTVISVWHFNRYIRQHLLIKISKLLNLRNLLNIHIIKLHKNLNSWAKYVPSVHWVWFHPYHHITSKPQPLTLVIIFYSSQTFQQILFCKQRS